MGALPVKVKICGMTSVEDAVTACELGADAVGMVFSESPRKVTLDAAREIAGRVSPFVTVVGVFVNEEKEFVSECLAYCKLDLIQLHGDETPGYCAAFAGRSIKSFRILEARDLSSLGSFSVRAALLDSRVEGSFGGTGRSFDWTIVGDVSRFGVPIILAGGLNPGNVARAIGIVRPYAVDVSSGVERAPGEKDHTLMGEFIRRAKNGEGAS